MLHLDVAPDLQARFSNLAAQLNKTEQDMLSEALLAYLEDCEDIIEIRRRLAEGNPVFTLEEVRHRLDSDLV